MLISVLNRIGWIRSFRSASLAFAVTGVFVTLVAGCGGGGSSGKFKAATRADASGSVTFDGQPVASGSISFTNKETGIPSLCTITNGKYVSEKSKGPQIGLNVVSISSKEADGKLIWASSAPQEVAVDDTKFAKDFAVTAAQVKMAASTKTAQKSNSNEKKWPGDED